jgi:tetratricopeptide (TPR) repeat protein
MAILPIISKSIELEQFLTNLIAEKTHSIEINPGNANEWCDRGRLLTLAIEKNAQQIIHDYNEALRIDPDGKTLVGFEERHKCLEMIGIAKAYLIIKNGEDDKGGYVEPDDMIGLHWRGVGFSLFYEYERAIKDYDAALALKPNDYDTAKDRELAIEALNENMKKPSIEKLAKTLPMGILQRHIAVDTSALGILIQKKIDGIIGVQE